jgi:hypothetical protein
MVERSANAKADAFLIILFNLFKNKQMRIRFTRAYFAAIK